MSLESYKNNRFHLTQNVVKMSVERKIRPLDGILFLLMESNSYSKKKEILISHLALGEAYGKCCSRSKEAEQAFLELISKIREHIKIVDNTVSNKLFNDIRKICPRGHITDLIHLATAIKYKCENLRTADRDLYGIDKKRIQQLGKKYGIKNFRITEVKIT